MVAGVKLWLTVVVAKATPGKSATKAKLSVHPRSNLKVGIPAQSLQKTIRTNGLTINLPNLLNGCIQQGYAPVETTEWGVTGRKERRASAI
jgi:hypothetical protein